MDIDLYADVEDFNSDDAVPNPDDADPKPKSKNSENGGDDIDLYDDVIASSSATSGAANEEKKVGEEAKPDVRGGDAHQRPGRKYQVNAIAWLKLSRLTERKRSLTICTFFQLYVGNLTWWTSDQDIQDAVAAVGVDDFLEVKFYENKINGQSKGFCCVSLGSERSMQKVMEEMPKKELHSQLPVVSYPTRQALYQFESQSKTRPPTSGQGQGGGGGRPPSGPPPPGRDSRPPPHHHPPPYGGDRGRGPPHGPPPSGYPPPQPAPSYGRPPPHALPPPMSRPPPMMAPGIPPPALYHPPPAHPIPHAHVNPAFIPGAPPGLPPPPGPLPAGGGLPHGISEREFEDIMARNRTVSSSAIARAVQDAASGEFGSAIETLVTAISLIKQSKVADDDRCRILISSLQDTLQGIENKSYSAGGGRRRERSRSPQRREYREREYERDHYRPRDREYSRDFDREREFRSRRDDYHHHHRDSRDKYYEDRYRGREESSRSRGRDDVVDDRDRH